MSFENTGFTPVLTKLPVKINPEDKLPNWLQSSTRIEVYGTQGTMYLGRHFLGLAGAGPGQQDRGGEIRPRTRKAPLPELGRLHPQSPAAQRDIEVGHMGACLEHFGNIAYRMGNQQ